MVEVIRRIGTLPVLNSSANDHLIVHIQHVYSKPLHRRRKLTTETVLVVREKVREGAAKWKTGDFWELGTERLKKGRDLKK